MKTLQLFCVVCVAVVCAWALVLIAVLGDGRWYVVPLLIIAGLGFAGAGIAIGIQVYRSSSR